MIITQTPLRISFLGGNTDFPAYYKENGGLILTTAIDKYIYCIVKERFDDLIYVNYSVKEIVNEVTDIKHDIVREALRMVRIKKGIEITFLSDIPSEGSGLGSSSAVTVGLLNALYQYIGNPKTLAELSSRACNIEIDRLKRPIGVQDQIITAYGGFRLLRLADDDVVVEKIEVTDEVFNDLNHNLMLFYTNKTRSADKILKNMTIDKKILDKNKELANEGYKLIKSGQIGHFGRLLDKYWQLKKKLNDKVSDPDIDSMYKKAIKAGATGGKVLGAGGGGFLLLFVPDSAMKSVREAMIGHQEVHFGFDNGGSRVILHI